ncbi:DarT ssDNA thymidine ADP-ribosyltransferase family protein [Microbacterium sp. P04]|uniref:DarT ssDNA thymidine ADP-ribosyltransferase family protein n=1 Tax=Microbacterium sp. P04 TaxID=3366947 RepID=UPI003744C4F8
MTTPSERARERGVTELLHFTTSRGLIGILAQGKIHSRKGLNEEQYLENIKLLNSPDRSRDADWWDWVNLSVSQVNSTFLGHSHRWHADDDIWWACLSFDVEILDHPGVYFCTGNNAYPATKREQGVAGLEGLFAPVVYWGKWSTRMDRPTGLASSLPTDPQAEVLYPKALSLEYARAIYVPEPELTDDVAGMIGVVKRYSAIDLSGLPISARPDVFQ